MSGRIAMYANHCQPLQIGLCFFIQPRAVYYLIDTFLRYHPHRIRKVTAKIYLDNPRGPGIALRYLKDVLYQLIDSCLATHTFAIVEGEWRQHLVGFGDYYLANLRIYHTTAKLCGEDFAPTWTWCKEGIVMQDAECAVIAIIHGTHQQRRPVHFKLYGVLPSAFILPCLLHQPVKINKPFFFSQTHICVITVNNKFATAPT